MVFGKVVVSQPIPIELGVTVWVSQDVGWWFVVCRSLLQQDENLGLLLILNLKDSGKGYRTFSIFILFLFLSILNSMG